VADIDDTNGNEDLIGDALGESGEPDEPDEDLGEAVDPASVEGGHVGGNVEPVGLRDERHRRPCVA
jgi:hypothetical protein